MFWKKKAQKAQEPEKFEIKSPCELGKHRYKDFKWYIQTQDVVQYGNRKYIVRVIEPYVCIHCGHRNNETLQSWSLNSRSERDEMVAKIQKRYEDRIGNTLEIEDEIKDMQLVDREYLTIMQQLHPERNIVGGNDDE